ncbi:sugar phosphate permease [Cryptosporidium ryanae]|uniref:sugar phosphate permease n=1 Tax=Cryptosporidium ryanae TaxID=515981 RepID=UPI003519E8FF|nr:sugar phosphate permease [Cryptosporidium ryanae]
MRDASILNREFNDGYCEEEIDLTKDDIELLDGSEYDKFGVTGTELLDGKNSTFYSSLEKSSLKSNIDHDMDNKFCILMDGESTVNEGSFKVGVVTLLNKTNGNLSANISRLVFDKKKQNETKTDNKIIGGYIVDNTIIENKSNNAYAGHCYPILSKILNYVNTKLINKFLPKMSKDEYCQFLLAYTSYMVLYSTRKPFSVVKLQIQDDLSLPTSMLGWIDTAFLGSYALGQLILPSLFESIMINKYLCCSFLLSSVSSVIFGLSNNSISLLFSWFFNGLFHAGAYPMLVKYLIQCFGLNNRGKILSVWTTSQQLGAIISTGFSASICSKLGWRSVFYIPSVLVFMFGILIYKYLNQPANNFKYEESVKIIMMKDTNKNNRDEEYLDFSYGDNNPISSNFADVKDSYCDSNFGSSMDTTNCSTIRDNSSNKLVSYSNSSVLEGICLGDEGKEDKFSLDSPNDSGEAVSDESLDGLKKKHQTGLNDRSLSKFFTQDTYSLSSELSPTKNKYKKTGNSDKTITMLEENEIEKGESTEDSLKNNYSETNDLYCTSFNRIYNEENISLSDKVKLLFKVQNIFNIAICYFLVKLIRYSLLFWLPYYLIRVLNYDPSIAGYSSMLFDIGGIAGAISAGSIADGIFSGKRIMVTFYMTIMISFSIINFIIITSFKANFLILFGIMLMGFCISGPDSILGSTATQDILDNSGLKTKYIDSMATGIVNGLGSLGAVAQGALTAYISEYYGWNSLFSCLILFSTTSFFILLPIALNKRTH